ncbi:MAG: tocopherol cyclase family protein [Eubacteriales bacterium]|nr:tocopherol cyclase family protein [Eubacteriales bacterium]
MTKKAFEGWYFKHQKGQTMLAFIPGQAQDGAFLQMLWPRGSRRFHFPQLQIDGAALRAGACRFSGEGCHVELPGVRGDIAYGPLTPLASDIMGPFRFFPMECRHGVLSMAHSLTGSVTIDGKTYSFDGGTGYWEKDSGLSFPRSYLWVQCNTFPEPCAMMASVAEVPFLGLRFRGCICAVLYRGREYRFATYRGVRILAATRERLSLVQGSLRLDLRMMPTPGHPLLSPAAGKMSVTVRECCNASLHMRLWENGRLILDQRSNEAAYEFI